MRFFLIDRVTSLDRNCSIEGVKAWSLDNEIFLDHFPGQPIVPGVMLTESMAQLLGILVELSYYDKWGEEFKVFPILSIIQKAKFRKLVRPGDQTILKGELTSLDKNRAVGKVKLYVNQELKAEAILSFSIASSKDIKPNKFMERREEFMHIILSDIL